MKGSRLIFGLLVLFVVLFPAVVWFLLWTQAAQAVAPAAPDIGAVSSAFSDIVSPVFAVLAFGGLVITALMQREELSLQRRELSLQRQELKRQADAQEAVEEEMALQVITMSLAAEASAMESLLATDGRRFQMPDGEWMTTIIPEAEVRDIRNRSKRILKELDIARSQRQELLEKYPDE